MKKINFYNQTQEVRTITTPFTCDEFITTLKSNKPKEIFNGGYSHDTPLYIIEKYDDDVLWYSCNGLADKTPRKMTYVGFYETCQVSGISSLYFKVKDEDDAWCDFRECAYNAWAEAHPDDVVHGNNKHSNH